MSAPPLIMGHVKGLTKEQIAPFLASLEDVGYSGDVVLFVSKLDKKTTRFLEAKQVELVAIPRWQHSRYHMQNARWFRYREYLMNRVRRCEFPEAVLFADVRDVIFQRDPFKDATTGVEFYEEDDRTRIGDCCYNSGWIKGCFGSKVLAEFAPLTISCCGTVLGSGNGVLEYLLHMETLLRRIPFVAALDVADQGVHNFIVHRRMVADAKLFGNGQRVFTLGTVPAAEMQVEAGGMIVNREGRVSPIVHQYDRHPMLVDAVYRRLRLPCPSRSSQW